MSLWQLFVTALFVALSGALMPGPLLAVNIKESLRRGAWTGPLLILGHALLELTLISTILLGFGRWLDLGVVKGAIGLIGGVVLLWMAWGMFREAGAKMNLSWQEGAESRGMPLVLAGIVVSLSNPYWFIWWATIGLSYLPRARELSLSGVAIFFIGHILADLSWYSAVSIAVARGRRLFSGPVYRAVVFLCGLFLVYMGLWFADSSLGFLGLTRPSAMARQVIDKL